ncbi:diguanylate cyclase [Pseudoxanthomonas sp.]|uniref:GGDEF domain-containing protein n=1 Tax=Pseudoxanthomonas sp. TaxID=1871049 RepID=UPI002FE3A23A
MPTPAAVPVPLLTCLLGLALLLGLPSSRAQGTQPVAQDRASQVTRCLQLRRDAPPVAVALAESLLREPDLTVEDEVKIFSCLGIAAGLAGDRTRAVDAGAQMERLVHQHPALAVPFRARAYSQAGSVFHGAGQIHRAEAAYLRAQHLAAQLPADEAALFQATTLSNLGLIHADYLDSPEVADGYHRKALGAARSVGLEDPLILYNHALNLVRLGRTEEALAVIDEGEAMASRKQAQAVAERLRAERAGIWVAQGRLAQARPVLEAAIQMQETRADKPGLAGSLAKLSVLQRMSGDTAGALATARRAWTNVDGTPQPQKQREVLRAWIAAHAALGQADDAMAVGARLHALEMQTLKEQRLELLADLQARSESAAAQRELETMRHQAQIRVLNDEKSTQLRRSGIALLVLLVLAGVGFGLLQRRKNRQLHKVSATDPLTGLRNRRAATEAMKAISSQRPAAGTRHVLFLIDIDHFKQVNDSFGHHAGDQVLVALACRLRDLGRVDDVIARWGGEEFLMACADLTEAQACTVAARLHEALCEVHELAPRQRWSLTVSLGFAPFPFFDNTASGWDYALRMADRALYAAKDRRNAWAGLWGRALPADATLQALLEAPEEAVRSGAIGLVASYAVERLPQVPATRAA